MALQANQLAAQFQDYMRQQTILYSEEVQALREALRSQSEVSTAALPPPATPTDTDAFTKKVIADAKVGAHTIATKAASGVIKDQELQTKGKAAARAPAGSPVPPEAVKAKDSAEDRVHQVTSA